jgi:hypothetical protein
VVYGGATKVYASDGRPMRPSTGVTTA